MKKVITSVGLLALGAVGIQNAHADWAAGTDKLWTVQGTLRGFYDDNYNDAANGPDRKGSYGFEVRPSGNIHYSNGQTTLSASYTYDLMDYVDRPGNKLDQSHDFEFDLNHNFNERYALGVTESFVIAQEPEVLNSTLSAPLRDNGDNIHNNAAASFSAQVTKLLGFVLSYSNDYWDYTGNVPANEPGAPSYGTTLNRFQHQVTLDSRWQLEPETVGVLGYQFAAIDYTGDGSLTGPGGAFFISPKVRNSYANYAYVGADHNFLANLSGSVRVGAEIMDYYNQLPGSGSPNTLSPYAQLNLIYTYMDGGNLGFGFNYSHNPTDQAVSNDEVTQDQESSTVYLSVTQVLKPLSPKLTATVTGQYQNSTFNGGGLDGEVDNFYLLGFNLSYQFTKYLSSEVGYNYNLLNSDVNNRGFHENRVYIGVTASY